MTRLLLMTPLVLLACTAHAPAQPAEPNTTSAPRSLQAELCLPSDGSAAELVVHDATAVDGEIRFCLGTPLHDAERDGTADTCLAWTVETNQWRRIYRPSVGDLDDPVSIENDVVEVCSGPDRPCASVTVEGVTHDAPLERYAIAVDRERKRLAVIVGPCVIRYHGWRAASSTWWLGCREDVPRDSPRARFV